MLCKYALSPLVEYAESKIYLKSKHHLGRSPRVKIEDNKTADVAEYASERMRVCV